MNDNDDCDSPFYMHALEEVLMLLCEMYERRVRLIAPLAGYDNSRVSDLL